MSRTFKFYATLPHCIIFLVLRSFYIKSHCTLTHPPTLILCQDCCTDCSLFDCPAVAKASRERFRKFTVHSILKPHNLWYNYVHIHYEKSLKLIKKTLIPPTALCRVRIQPYSSTATVWLGSHPACMPPASVICLNSRYTDNLNT